jgi:hypothetical protein
MSQVAQPAPGTSSAESQANPPQPDVQLAAARDEAQRLLAEQRRDHAEQRRLTDEARRTAAETAVDRVLMRLADRVAPSLVNAGLKPLLIALAAMAQPVTIKLTQAGAAAKELERNGYDALVAVLEALPKMPVSRELADGAHSDPAPGDRRSTEARALHLRHGITDARAAELEAKYPARRATEPEPEQSN